MFDVIKVSSDPAGIKWVMIGMGMTEETGALDCCFTLVSLHVLLVVGPAILEVSNDSKLIGDSDGLQ